jgi:hypothetical protein
MADESMDAYNASAEDEARVKAEARRQRILEKSRERMGVVAGELPASRIVVEEVQEETPQAEPAAPSGESRMQAMRRRRFKKAGAQTKGHTDVTEEKEDTLQAESNETQAAAAETNASDAAPTASADDTITTDTAESSTETKKKYKGVARMRREMIKKKEKNAKSETEAVLSSTTVPVLKKAPVPVLPIFFHFTAVLLLFLAGIDIGWNQVVFSDVIVYRDITPMVEGVGLVNWYTDSSFSKTDLLDPSKLAEVHEYAAEEEFVTDEEQKEEYIPNIDPIFQVDFDKLTEGGGLLNTLAKGAINCHRLILQVFYYLPISILQTVMAIPQQLLTTPPILCIISLVVRQSAKLIFGKLPEPASEKKDSMDVLAMMKQGIMNFLAGLFPTMVGLYDVWTHLRSDMYVILCGVFVGLAFTHHFVEQEATGSSLGGKDEL